MFPSICCRQRAYESWPGGMPGCDYTVSVACTAQGVPHFARRRIIKRTQYNRLGSLRLPDGGRNSTPMHHNGGGGRLETRAGPGGWLFKECHNYTAPACQWIQESQADLAVARCPFLLSVDENATRCPTFKFLPSHLVGGVIPTVRPIDTWQGSVPRFTGINSFT